MLAWWGDKSSKVKQKLKKPHNPPETPRKLHFVKPSNRGDVIKRDTPAVDDKPRSSDGLGLLNSSDLPRSSREFGMIGASSSRFSGFESDGTPLPLPRPSTHFTSSPGINLPLHTSEYASVSSVSSSGSSDDHSLQDQAHFRVNGENKVSTRSKSPCSGRVVTPTTVSPLPPQVSCSSFDSPTKKQQEDGKGHRLPLPPSSPTKSSSFAAALPFTKTSGVSENSSHIISKWKKGRLLGRGTFGHVYLGFNNESGKFCAIKEVRVLSDDQSSKECLRQLNQEISLLSQLLHPNIVQYYGSELGEESLTVFLEYVSGGSIHRLLQEYGPFKEPVIQNYTRQILSGLAYLHGRNTVHRDIKGANILVDPNGEIKLADFGMAKHITACSSMLSFKGSPYWMAPEVVMNTNGYSLPVDIWSLGCTILEMAMAKPPWSQFEGVAAIFKIGNSKDLPEIPPHLSKDAQNFVKRCLHRDPLMRPTALELLDHSFISGIASTSNASPFPIEKQHPCMESQSNNRAPNMTSCDRNYMTMPVASRVMKNPRGSSRMITSLPVSPCGSPHKSFFLSPPHPTSNSSLNMTAHSVLFPTRPNNSRRRGSLDVLHETSLIKR